MAGSPCATPLTVTGSLSSCRLRSNPRATFWVWSRAYGEFDGGQEEGPAGTSGEAQVDSQPLGQVASPNARISPQQK
ncbi:hypothetical protein E4U35_003529, partial [Claviceps purpurea]